MEIMNQHMQNDENLIQLELPILLKKLSELIRSPYGQDQLKILSTIENKELIKTKLNEVTEMVSLMEDESNLPIIALPEIRHYLEKTQPEDAFLEASELNQIKFILNTFSELKQFVKRYQKNYPHLARYSDRIHLHTSLLKEIEATLDQKGEIREDASRELRAIRLEIHRLEAEQKKVLLKVLKRYTEFSQDDIVTMRDGRLVLGIQQQYVNRINGIVHGTSGTGATVFIEPMETLRMSNQIQNLKIDERKEIIRILKFLTGLVREIRGDLYYSIENYGILDFVHAKAQLSKLLDASAPHITDDHKLYLINARHPLLSLRDGVQHVVPLTLQLGENYNTIIITGPNAGGKTVALKTVGLLAVMALMGFHIPAHPDSEIPLLESVLVDIGDRQNLEQDLSTFSAHILRLQEILKKATARTLILVDEIGTGTDPREGSALGIALIRKLTELNSLTVATTHHGELKVFAHQTESVENASMEFDVDSLQPTYRLRIGIPGSSYAFEIAHRYGLSESVLRKAKQILGEDKGNLENMIIKLNERLQEVEKEYRELNIKLSQAQGLKILYEKEMDKFKSEKSKRIREAAAEANLIISEANAKIEKIIAEIRKNQASKSTIRKAHGLVTSMKEQTEKILAQSQPDLNKSDELHSGEVVWIESLNSEGEILSDPDSKEKVWVLVNDVRLRLSVRDLRKIGKKKIENDHVFKQEKGISDNLKEGITPELDLRGMDSYEAAEAMTIYLDQAMEYGWDEVRIIHGKGTGVLRKKINEILSRDARVEEKRLGKWGEGDSGVTVVKLKK